MVISHVSGAACPTLINVARQVGARVEAPDQILQFSKLAKQRRGWFEDSVDDQVLASEPSALPTLVMKAQVGSHQANLHLIVEAQLRYAPSVMVSASALGQGSHNPEISAPAVILPPMGGMGA